MMQLKRWQWIVLALPLVAVITFITITAGIQLRTWGITWIWAVILLVFVGWRWLLVHWTKPREIEQIVTAVKAELTSVTAEGTDNQTLEASLQPILTAAREDPPVWDDWSAFWQRCQTIVVTVAHHYHPEVKYPLLNIYVTQAYGLIRGTVDDMDRAMTQLAPVLNKVTVGQAYEAYEIYRKLEPSMGKLWQAWNWAQWLINPAAAAAKMASQKSSTQANQQLLVNLSQLLRETALRNLAQQSAALYGGDTLPITFEAQKTPKAVETEAKTATLRSILDTATPAETIEQKPVSLMLIGRTGAGKSSLINTLFKTELAEVDVLPSTDKLRQYRWQLDTGEGLNLIDSPGYEQINREDFRDLVFDQAADADLLVMATPALDPALQSDKTFLQDLKTAEQHPPTVVVLTQVDRLRPVREWLPPYDWQLGQRPKEIAIREAVAYRVETLGQLPESVVPLVTYDSDRTPWNDDTLALKLVDTLGNAKQYRLARFLTNQTALAKAAAKLIDQYTFQMTTTQGVTELLKSPILRYLSRMMTGSDLLATALMEKIPVEQTPVVIGKLQLAYDLFNLLAKDESTFDLLKLWPTLLDNDAPPEQNAWAFGHALTTYWLGETNQLDKAFEQYLQKYLDVKK